jgi:hypothetical protein
MRELRHVAAVALMFVPAAACSKKTVSVDMPRASASQSSIGSTEALLRAMHDRYAGKWYRNLTFVQTSTFYKPDGTVDRAETWREAGLMPGRLRIDTDTATGRGVIYANDSLYVFQEGKLARTLDRQNELMVLGFDVYFLSPEQSIAKLQKLGFDLTKFRRELHEGREYYVVGAGANDLTSKQFWIDAEYLLFWRVFLPPRQPGAKLQEIRFQNYKQHGGGWVAEEVDFLEDGKRTFFERYADVKTNTKLDESVFDPKRYGETRFWWR